MGPLIRRARLILRAVSRTELPIQGSLKYLNRVPEDGFFPLWVSIDGFPPRIEKCGRPMHMQVCVHKCRKFRKAGNTGIRTGIHPLNGLARSGCPPRVRGALLCACIGCAEGLY